MRNRRLTLQLPLNVLKQLIDIFLDGSLDEERIQGSAKDAAQQLIRGIDAGIGLVTLGLQRPGEPATDGSLERLPDLESTVRCMPARWVEANNSEFLGQGHSRSSVDRSERITHASRAPPHLHNPFQHQCTLHEILGVINEFKNLLDWAFDRHCGVDLGRKQRLVTDLLKRIRHAYCAESQRGSGSLPVKVSNKVSHCAQLGASALPPLKHDGARIDLRFLCDVASSVRLRHSRS